MPILVLAGLLVNIAPDIFKLGSNAWSSYKKIVEALKTKTGTPEERLALDLVDQRMRQLDIEVANAPEPD